MWLSVGAVCVIAVILAVAAALDRRGRRAHRIRSGAEMAADFRSEHRDARIVDRSNGLFLPQHQPHRDADREG